MQLASYNNRLICPVYGRNKTTGSERVNSLAPTAIAVASLFFLLVSLALVPTEGHEEDQVTPGSTLNCLLERNPELREPESFIMGSKRAFPLLWEETLSPSANAVLYTKTFLEQ